MTPEQKLNATIEKLSRLTVKRGATPAEEAMAKKKIKVLQERLVVTGPMTGPGIRDDPYNREPFTLTPERMERLKRNMKEWNDFIDDMYRRNGVTPKK